MIRNTNLYINLNKAPILLALVLTILISKYSLGNNEEEFRLSYHYYFAQHIFSGITSYKLVEKYETIRSFDNIDFQMMLNPDSVRYKDHDEIITANFYYGWLSNANVVDGWENFDIRKEFLEKSPIFSKLNCPKKYANYECTKKEKIIINTPRIADWAAFYTEKGEFTFYLILTDQNKVKIEGELNITEFWDPAEKDPHHPANWKFSGDMLLDLY